MSKEMGDAKSYRMDIGYELLMSMERDDELPLPNKERLAKVMNEYFVREAIVDKIKDAGYSWVPDAEYWTKHLADLCEHMRSKYRLYFAFIREDGEFTGIWKFTNKGEWEKALRRDHQDISTRVENHNDKIDDTRNRWNIPLARIADVPRLTE
jgi:hypothetical protein